MKKSLFITTIIMVVVLIVALSTATYAWFTVSGTVTVSEVQFSAVTTENLEISLSPDTGYSNTVILDWSQPAGGIWPVSLKVDDGLDPEAEEPWWFYELNETGGVTIDISEQYLVKELYLRSSGDMSVSLSGASFIVPNQVGGNMNGTIDRDLLVGAVRLAIFDKDDNLLVVWAPNSNIKLTEVAGGYVIVTDDAENENEPDETYEDKFVTQTGSTLASEIPLIELEAGFYQKITVLVWIEGTDTECHNVLTGGKFNVGLSFVGA